MQRLRQFVDGTASRRGALGALLVLALAVRLVAVALAGDATLVYEFDTLTRHLLDGHGYAYWSETSSGEMTEAYVAQPSRVFPSAYMPPAYPVFLWGLTSVVGTERAGIVVVEGVQALLGVASVWLLWLIALRLFDRRVAWLAALAAAVYPVLAFTAAQISAATLTVFLLTLFLWLVLRAAESGRASDAAWAGVALGANVLVRAEFVLFIPVVALWLLVARGRQPVRTAALVVGVGLLVLVPWTVRNAQVLGVATPMTTSGGLNLWQGHNPVASGTHLGYTVTSAPPTPGLADALAAVPRTDVYEVERDAVYRTFALREIAADPLRSLRLAARKAWLLWGHFGGRDIAYPGAESPAFWVPWLLVLPPFVAGLWYAARTPDRRRWLLVGYLGVQTVVAMAFFVLPRYRVFLLPVVVLYAAYGIARWLEPVDAPSDRLAG